MEAILGDDCLYGVLGLPPRGTAENKKLRPEDITRAYRKMALQFHPDMNATPEATPMFQKVSAAYNVLRTPEGRQRYDKDGTVDVAGTGRAATTRSEDWMEVFRTLYKEVNEQEVAAFYATYLDTEEERADIVKYYEGTKGDFELMAKSYLMYPNEVGHVSRIKAIILDLIEKGAITACKKFTVTSSPAKVKQLEEFLEEERTAAEAEAAEALAEAEQAASRRKSGKGKSKTDLQLQVFQNSKKFDDYLNVLEGKYADTENKPKRQKKSK